MTRFDSRDNIIIHLALVMVILIGGLNQNYCYCIVTFTCESEKNMRKFTFLSSSGMKYCEIYVAKSQFKNVNNNK